jgi:hypothetical protein
MQIFFHRSGSIYQSDNHVLTPPPLIFSPPRLATTDSFCTIYAFVSAAFALFPIDFYCLVSHFPFLFFLFYSTIISRFPLLPKHFFPKWRRPIFSNFQYTPLTVKIRLIELRIRSARIRKFCLEPELLMQT